jgi:putative peptidoglycan lipid II flippase
MAAMIGPGSVATLSYGNKVVSFIMGTGSMALGTAVLPHVSRMVVMADWGGLRHTLKTYARLIALVTVPLTLIIVYFSSPIVGLLYERGAFTTANTQLVSRVQAFYLLQMPFYMVGMLGVRVLSALIKNQILMIISGINLIVNILGNYFLMKVLGVAGISLSTSIVYMISMSLIFLSLSIQLKKQEILNGI